MKNYQSNLPEISLKYKSGDILKAKISKSQDAYEIFKQMFDADNIEYFESAVLLLLNKANNTIGWLKISQGGIDGTVMDVRLIYTTALKAGASAIMLAHNHPSGNLKPSQTDIHLTKKIKDAGKLLEIHLLDHLIITNEGYTSMSDDGLV